MLTDDDYDDDHLIMKLILFSEELEALALVMNLMIMMMMSLCYTGAAMSSILALTSFLAASLFNVVDTEESAF